MYRAGLIAILVLMSLGSLWSLELDWGIKYGLGSSILQGYDRAYELNYDLYELGTNPNYLGYIRLRSHENKDGLAQNAGLYASLPIAQQTHSVRLHTELLWHRYKYNYQFKEHAPSVSNLIFASALADTLTGRIEGTADYLSLPIFISLNQGLSEEQLQKSYQGAHIYVGPSFSLLLNQENNLYGGIKSLEAQVQNFVTASLTDDNPDDYYSYEKKQTGSDEFTDFKTDLVVGAGFALKDIFQFGLGKDEFVFDFRFTMALNDLGNAGFRDAITLRSIMFSLGCKL